LNNRSESVNTGSLDVRKRQRYRDDDCHDDDAAKCNSALPGVCRHGRDHEWKIVRQ
jgi:hypothetical protein